MNNKELKDIVENLIPTFDNAGEESIKIEKEGVKIKTKPTKIPEAKNMKVNDLLITSFVSSKLFKFLYSVSTGTKA